MISFIFTLVAIFACLSIILFIVHLGYHFYIILTKGYTHNLIVLITENKYYGISLLATFCSFLLIFILDLTGSHLLRKETISALQTLRKNDISLTINGIPSENDSIKYKMVHLQKSSFIDRKTGNPKIKVLLSNPKKSYHFLLTRSFDNDKKYWVELLSKNKHYQLIGQIFTNQLDDIQ